MSDAARWLGQDSGKTRVVVVGGGISGMATAHRLHELARQHALQMSVRLLEASDRCGGQIRTERSGDVLLECGPESIVTHKPAALALCRRLDLEPELIYPDPSHAGMEVVHDGRLVGLPTGLAMLAPTRFGPLLHSSLLSWSGKGRAVLERFIPRGERAGHDESLRSFVTRRFGPELFERIAEPILAGLFMADADRMSLAMTFPRFLAMEQQHGNVTRGILTGQRRRKALPPAPTMFSLLGGVGRMAERLVERLPDEWVIPGAGVTSLDLDRASGTWRVGLATGSLEADVLVLACPSHVSADLLRPLDLELATDLSRPQHVSCATVNLLYRRSDFGRDPSGFGFFVPRTERSPLIACNYVSMKFPERAPDDRVLLRAFLGGALHPDVLRQDDDEIARQAHGALRPLLAIRGEPSLVRVRRHPLSMPQYPVGDRDRIERIVERAEAHRGLFVCGDALGAFGLPDCIRSGEEAAGQVVELVDSRASALQAAI